MVFRLWWEEATGPMNWSWHMSPLRAVLRRLLLWTPVLVVISAAALWGGFQYFTGKRAAGLSALAMENMRNGNWRAARLQVASAENLRGNDLVVRRARLFFDSRTGDSSAPARWEALAGEVALSAEEREERARSSMLHGSAEQRAAALADLEAMGMHSTVAALRSSWHFSRGDLEQAIRDARAAVEKGGEPRAKLKLASLLAVRHGHVWTSGAGLPLADEEAAAEARGLIEQLRGTPLQGEALAFGLTTLPLSPDQARAWATLGLEDFTATNSALLPAASVAVRQGWKNARELAWRFSPIFAFTPVARQAALANWLCDESLLDEALVAISEKEARQDDAAFAARARALASAGRWEELLQLSEAGANASESLLSTTRYIAARQSDRQGIAAQSLSTALTAAVRTGRLSEVAGTLDANGAVDSVDEEIVRLCADPASADSVFRIARDRFSRLGKPGLLQEAFLCAQSASPSAASVDDYRRRTDLLAGRRVDLAETAAAIDRAPADPVPRFTHTLNLLLAGRPAEAEAVFDDMDIFVEQLAPCDKAIVIAVLRANGDTERSERLLNSIEPAHLTAEEKKLVDRPM